MKGSASDKKLSVADLSADQRVVYDEMMQWALSARRVERGEDPPLLTTGGFGGCLSGDTMLAYNRGARANMRPISLRDLYLKFNGFNGSGRGQSQRWADLTMPTFLESLWPDGSIALNRIVAVFESGVKKVLRLTLTDGKSIVATSDHPIAVPDGSFVPAGDLKEGEFVLVRGTLRSAAEGRGQRPLSQRPPRVIVNTKYHPTGAYKAVEYNGVTYEYMREARARLVVEAVMNNIDYDEFVHALKYNAGLSATFKYLPTGVEVHHIDEDTLNDDISNLEVLSKSEHARIHGIERSQIDVEYTRQIAISSIEPLHAEMTYDIQMEPPANNFVANGIIVHNTGKSTLLGVLAQELLRTKKIAFCCFTGKASSVLQRKLRASGVETTNLTQGRTRTAFTYHASHPEAALPYCGTIHRLLYAAVVDDKTEQVLGYREREELDRPYDLIVSDESSMIGNSLLTDMKKHGTPILAVGDHGQLPPVGDAGGLMDHPDLRLEKIHRQAEGNPIIQLSRAIREEGRMPPKYADGERVFFSYRSKAQEVFDEIYGSTSPLDVGLLCWTNRNRIMMNKLARKALGISGAPGQGDVLLALRNKPPVYNGMRGLVTGQTAQGFAPWHLEGMVGFPDELLAPQSYRMCAAQFNREKTFKDLDELHDRGIRVDKMGEAGEFFDFGYALTVHRSQGSSFTHAVYYADMPETHEDWRRMAYTAVSRASEKLTVLR